MGSLPRSGNPNLKRAHFQRAPCSASSRAENTGQINLSSRVGILGGGQLGLMLAEAAGRLGVIVDILDPQEHCPASRIARRHVRGSLDDAAAMRELAAGCDVITLEIEHVNVDSLQALEDAGVAVQPAPATVRIIQDKFRQKMHVASHRLPCADFQAVYCLDEAISVGEGIGYPLVLKSRFGAYDGRGNIIVHSAEGMRRSAEALGGFDAMLYIEHYIPFEAEVAVIVAKDRSGGIRSYPPTMTTHWESICYTTETPIPTRRNIDGARATTVAKSAVASFPEGAGVYGVELFALPNGSLLYNEIAPRPHNSGHYTIEACVCSQFEMHIRCVAGLPMGDPSLKVGAAAMVNFLGTKSGFEGLQEKFISSLAIPGVSLHWYHKIESRVKRKMGHVTIVADDRAQLDVRLDTILRIDAGGEDNISQNNHDERTAALKISPKSLPQVGIIMGSDSDLPVMRRAAEILQDFGITCEVTIVSAHRTPQRMFDYVRSAQGRGLKCIIAGAGGAAHLPGMAAALTPLPVIGVPVKTASSYLPGTDALYSIVQMPSGIPVATVGIGNAANAALLAVRILGTGNATYLAHMTEYMKSMESVVLEKALQLEMIGWQDINDVKSNKN